jgi:DNA polymerase sigma
MEFGRSLERRINSSSGWDACEDEPRLAFTPSESTTILSGGLYRTLSDTGLDSTYNDTLNEHTNLRMSLQRQLNALRPSKHFVSNVSRLVTEMNTVVATYLNESASVVPYGSIASNFCLDNTAIDLLVFIPPDVFSSQFGSPGCKNTNQQQSEIPLGIVREFEVRQAMRKALARLGELFTVFCGLLLVRITNTVPLSSVSCSSRVPVLTMMDPVSGITFEIVCNSVLPLFSTRLVKAYNSLVPTGELRDFILLVKHWASRRNILGGPLSGFAWTLMCIFYCQSCLGIIPSLQALSTERQQWTDPFGSNRRCDVGFEDEKSLPPVLLPDGVSLFMGFIDFFANYWNWKNGVVSVRLGKLVSNESPEIFIKQTPLERCSCLLIEDPFDIKRDVCGGPVDRIRNELLESALLISAGATLGSLMAASTQLPRRRQKRAESAF